MFKFHIVRYPCVYANLIFIFILDLFFYLSGLFHLNKKSRLFLKKKEKRKKKAWHVILNSKIYHDTDSELHSLAVKLDCIFNLARFTRDLSNLRY